MQKLLQKMENVSKSVIAIITAVSAVFGVLLGIYHGIYKLNQTVSIVLTTIPVIEQNSKFAKINIDYDIALAEQQLIEKSEVDRILMRKLLLYEKDLTLTSNQSTSINYLKSRTKY